MKRILGFIHTIQSHPTEKVLGVIMIWSSNHWRMKNLYRNFTFIFKHGLHCKHNIRILLIISKHTRSSISKKCSMHAFFAILIVYSILVYFNTIQFIKGCVLFSHTEILRHIKIYFSSDIIFHPLNLKRIVLRWVVKYFTGAFSCLLTSK